MRMGLLRLDPFEGAPYKYPLEPKPLKPHPPLVLAFDARGRGKPTERGLEPDTEPEPEPDCEVAPLLLLALAFLSVAVAVAASARRKGRRGAESMAAPEPNQ